MFTPARLKRWGLVLFALSVFVYVHTMMVPGLADRVGRFKGADYIQFYVTGSLAVEGRLDALYDADAHLVEGRRRIHPDLQLYAAHPNYGPQVALAFAPLARLPFSSSLALFLALTTLCYGLSVWLLWRECDGLREHGWLVAILAAASPLFWNATRYGQTSTIALLLWSVAFVAWRRKRLFVAGLAIGTLAYKPQLGIVLAVVLLAARQWRVVGGAVVAAAAQLAVAVYAAGWPTMTQYFGMLWRLTLDPRLIQVYPTEIHSLRGFFQLLIVSPTVVSALSIAGLAACLAIAVRCWSVVGPPEGGHYGRGTGGHDGGDTVGLRWGQIVLLTVLASPHLVSYDLVLLTVAMLTFADWAVRHPEHDLSASIGVMLLVVYFAPFSGMIVARLTGVQVSVFVMAILAWRVYGALRATGSASHGETGNRRAEAGRGVVPELQHAGMTVEY